MYWCFDADPKGCQNLRLCCTIVLVWHRYAEKTRVRCHVSIREARLYVKGERSRLC